MSEFTFLTTEQCLDRLGNKREEMLEVIEKIGNCAPITDFSILLGGYVSNKYYYNNSILLKDRAGKYWLTTGGEEGVRIIFNDCLCGTLACKRTAGARPVLPWSSICNISSRTARGRNGILEVYYGEYPQYVASKKLQEQLERAYLDNQSSIQSTGKSYTIDSRRYDEYHEAICPISIEEYLFVDGEKYVRVRANSSTRDTWSFQSRNDPPAEFILSNGEIYKDDDYVWVEVQPIKWLIDEINDKVVSERILFAGVPFEHKNAKFYYTGNYEQSDIKRFVDNNFSKDIIPSSLNDITFSCSKETVSEENTQIEENEVELVKQRNPYGFNLEQVSEEDIIRGAIESDVPVFLHGQSSVGKSARVKQIDPDCVIIYLRNATPESLNGKSVYNPETGEMIDIKSTWLKKLEERCEKDPDNYHIVFLDEITNALPSIQGTAFNIVLDKEVNGIWKLPKNARIVAAGNDMKDSLAANQLAEPLFNRFAHVYIQTTVESWLQWASEHNIHPAIYTYIAYTRGESLRTKYDGEQPNADPRKWEMASRMLYATGQPEMLRALVGEDITREFVEFCNQPVITLDEVLEGNYTERDLEMNTSEIYATALGLSQVDEENFEKVREFILKLGGEPCAVFDSLWAHGNESRMEIVAEARIANNGGGKRV